MSAQFIYTMRKLSRFHPPDKEVLKDVSLSFFPGAKIGVLGANGAGKSSLLRVMAGVDDGFTGEARLTPGFTVGMLEQEPQLDAAKDVHGNVMDGVGQVAALLSEYDEVMAGWADPEADYEKLGARQADLESKIEAAGAWDLQRTTEIAMDALRLPPGDADVTTLSGGERRRVALCRLLLSRPDLLLLDEPTNHLDAESVAWLERFLRDYAGTVVAITHDRYFLDNVAGWILELDRGRGFPFEGNYSGWLEQKRARLDAEEKADSARRRTLDRELEWVRMAPKARQAKGKARLAAYEKLQAEAEAAERGPDRLQIHIPPGPHLGDQVIEAKGLSKGYGDRLLIDDLSFSLPRAGIVGIIGPNGAGKTTLFRMITGGEQPDARRASRSARPSTSPTSTSPATPSTPTRPSTRRSPTARTCSRSAPARSTAGPTWRRSTSAAPTSRRRSACCRAASATACTWPRCCAPAATSCCSTSRPTTSTSTRCAPSRTRSRPIPGCAVVISHDRWFLDRIATHILAFEGDSQVRWFEGNFSEYEAWRHKQLGAEADQPHRIKYKPLVR